ncbi:oxygenase MpaB family protein [Corynebacterium dentalis]|uniref:oxygenase MpaB family protein n=1 Tax=Corynebacterium dentalis TaxID=2014528 RepID=UPI00370D4AE7
MTDSQTLSANWPPSRGDYTEFVSRFGQERADRYAQAFHAKDPVADALFSGDRSVREIMPNLREALVAGRATENTFPEVAALIEDMASALEGIDEERFERGRKVYLSIPVIQHALAVGPGSLVHTYSTPAIADLLVNTGELTVGAIKRLSYTTNWTFSLYLPDSISRGGKGFVHTGMVRAMHAHVRRVHTTRGLDYSDWGAPISEFDMLRTWFDFTYIPYKGLRNMGWSLSKEEEQDVYYLWKIVGRMVGIPEDLMDGQDDIESSEETMDAIHSVDGLPNENTQALIDALMHGFVVNANMITGLPEDTLADWTAAYTRIIHGDEKADLHGISQSLMLPIIQMNVPSVQERFDLLRKDEEALSAEIKNNEEMVRQLLNEEEPAYLNQDKAPEQV